MPFSGVWKADATGSSDPTGSVNQYFWALPSSSGAAGAVLDTWQVDLVPCGVPYSLWGQSLRKKCYIYLYLHSRYLPSKGFCAINGMDEVHRFARGKLQLTSHSVGNFSRWVVVLGQRKMCRRDSEIEGRKGTAPSSLPVLPVVPHKAVAEVSE